MYASYLNFKIIYWRTFQKVHFGCSPKSHITNIVTEINYDIFFIFLPTFDIMPIFSFSLYLNSFLIYFYMWVRSSRPAFWYCHFLMNFKQMAELFFFPRKEHLLLSWKKKRERKERKKNTTLPNLSVLLANNSQCIDSTNYPHLRHSVQTHLAQKKCPPDLITNYDV